MSQVSSTPIITSSPDFGTLQTLIAGVSNAAAADAAALTKAAADHQTALAAAQTDTASTQAATQTQSDLGDAVAALENFASNGYQLPPTPPPAAPDTDTASVPTAGVDPNADTGATAGSVSEAASN